MAKLIYIFSLVIVCSVIQANARQCYVCTDCRTVDSSHIQTCAAPSTPPTTTTTSSSSSTSTSTASSVFDPDTSSGAGEIPDSGEDNGSGNGPSSETPGSGDDNGSGNGPSGETTSSSTTESDPGSENGESNEATSSSTTESDPGSENGESNEAPDPSDPESNPGSENGESNEAPGPSDPESNPGSENGESNEAPGPSDPESNPGSENGESNEAPGPSDPESDPGSENGPSGEISPGGGGGGGVSLGPPSSIFRGKRSVMQIREAEAEDSGIGCIEIVYEVAETTHFYRDCYHPPPTEVAGELDPDEICQKLGELGEVEGVDAEIRKCNICFEDLCNASEKATATIALIAASLITTFFYIKQ